MTWIMIVLCLLLGGCMNESATTDIDNQVIVVPSDSSEYPSDHFKNNFLEGKNFWNLIDQARSLKKSGNYAEAIKVLEKAYDQYSNDRSSQTIALSWMAECYEALSNYQLASNFYSEAAKTTMNPAQADEFNRKARALRQKAGLVDEGKE